MYRLTREEIKNVVNKGAGSLCNYCIKYGIHHVITGSSGGLDSTVKLGFAQKAKQFAAEKNFNLTSVGLIMPCQSKPEAERLGRKAIRKFNAEEIYQDFTELFEFAYQNVVSDNIQIKRILERTGGQQALKNWNWAKKIAQGNIKARLRMTFGTYHVARMMEGIVLSTDNLSEFWMAFWTLHGDVGDFGIIQNILKGLELYGIARFLDVPQEIIDAKPDDGLGVSGGDENQLGANYPTIDQVMIKLIQAGFDPDGSVNQLENIPNIDIDCAPEAIYKLAKRCLLGAFKRKGSIVLSRQDLGLTPINELRL